MKGPYRRADILALIVLAIFPLLAYGEPLLEHRLLGPGDGVALHLPMRSEAFRAYRAFSLPFLNTREFLATPLLAAYRGGVLYPLTILLSPFETFAAFQALIVISISLAGVLTYLYLKRLGAGAHGAFVGALCYAYGPYLLGHFEDAATLVASPMLPLVLMAAESHINRGTPARMVGLAVSFALLVFAGSPEALRACAILLFGRLLLGHTLGRSIGTPSYTATGIAILAGVFLAAPQWLPTLELLSTAGRQVTGIGTSAGDLVPGLAGLILRTVSHTPAAGLAIASLPLLFERLQVRVLLLAILAALALQVGRGPLLAPGALPLVVEFALAALAGLAMDEQWRERKTQRGRRLRAYFLLASLASAGVLSVAAATLGGLPDRLAAAVGVYAISLIVYFALADQESDVAAGVFLLPLAVSFALQPSSREVFKNAPTRSQLVDGTPARRAVDVAFADEGSGPRILSLVTEFPRDLALDFGIAGYGTLAPRTQANGYDPLAPPAVRRVFGEMGARGTLTDLSLMPDLDLLRKWSITAVQLPTEELTRAKGDEIVELNLGPGERRVLAIGAVRVRRISFKSEASDGVRIDVSARNNGVREIPLGRAQFDAKDGAFAITTTPYLVDEVIFTAAPDSRPVRIAGPRVEEPDGTIRYASRLGAYFSQPGFEDVVSTPQIRAFRVLDSRKAAVFTSGGERGLTIDPGGRIEISGKPGDRVEVAIPFLPGWTSPGGVTDASGRVGTKIESSGRATLRYVPPLFGAGLGLAATGLLACGLLFARPRILEGLLKTASTERK